MRNISPVDLSHKLANDQVVIVDVREPAEYRSEHIPHSYSLPLGEVSLSKLPTKNKSVVFLCRSGRRSNEACEKFIKLHPEIDVYSLQGGLDAWKSAGFSISSTSGGVLPLERQIQFVAGTLVLTGVVLGAFIMPAFYLLAGFVGCGLMFAGLTGWCGMGKLLALMPWNK